MILLLRIASLSKTCPANRSRTVRRDEEVAHGFNELTHYQPMTKILTIEPFAPLSEFFGSLILF
jgi:hypothetical protein